MIQCSPRSLFLYSSLCTDMVLWVPKVCHEIRHPSMSKLLRSRGCPWKQPSWCCYYWLLIPGSWSYIIKVHTWVLGATTFAPIAGTLLEFPRGDGQAQRRKQGTIQERSRSLHSHAVIRPHPISRGEDSVYPGQHSTLPIKFPFHVNPIPWVCPVKS